MWGFSIPPRPLPDPTRTSVWSCSPPWVCTLYPLPPWRSEPQADFCETNVWGLWTTYTVLLPIHRSLPALCWWWWWHLHFPFFKFELFHVLKSLSLSLSLTIWWDDSLNHSYSYDVYNNIWIWNVSYVKSLSFSISQFKLNRFTFWNRSNSLSLQFQKMIHSITLTLMMYITIDEYMKYSSVKNLSFNL